WVLAYPTGDMASSVLTVEQVGDREVPLGRPYTFQLRATNLTDRPLEDVVVRQKISSDLAISRTDPAPRSGPLIGDAPATKAAAEPWQEFEYALGTLPPRG